MSSDLQSIIGDWDYDPSSINARLIVGVDGKPKIQLRLDLGILQMETTDRPDGVRPRGAASLLEFHVAREKRLAKGGKDPVLTASDCAELQQEAAQYYYRYISFYAVHDLDAVERDTEHNLEIIRLVARRAENEELAWQFQQFLPYVRMMNARAQGERAAERKAFDEGIQAIEAGMADIQGFWQEHGEGDAHENCREIELLSELLDQYRQKKPRSQADRLREELARAIAAENYERAAVLRDELNTMVSK